MNTNNSPIISFENEEYPFSVSFLLLCPKKNFCVFCDSGELCIFLNDTICFIKNAFLCNFSVNVLLFYNFALFVLCETNPQSESLLLMNYDRFCTPFFCVLFGENSQICETINYNFYVISVSQFCLVALKRCWNWLLSLINLVWRPLESDIELNGEVEDRKEIKLSKRISRNKIKFKIALNFGWLQKFNDSKSF